MTGGHVSTHRPPIAASIVVPMALAGLAAVLADKVAHGETAYGGLPVGLALLVLGRWGARWRLVGLAVLGGWVFVDLLRPNGWQNEVFVTTIALLWFVALVGLDDESARQLPDWRSSVEGVAAAAAAGATAYVGVGHLAPAVVLTGYGLALVVLGALIGPARRVIVDASAGLVATGLVGVAATGLLAQQALGPRASTFGAISAVLVVALAARPPWWVVPVVVVAWAASGVLLAGGKGAIAGVGAASAALVATRTVPITARAAPGAWLGVVALGAAVVADVTGLVDPAAAIGTGMVLAAAAWAVPDGLGRPAQGWRDRWTAVAVRLVARSEWIVGGAVAAVQGGWDRVGGWLARPLRWLIAPTPERSGSLAARLPQVGWPSLLVPAGTWLAGATLVPALARAANAWNGGNPITWRAAVMAPWSTDPTGRIGWGTGDYWAIAAHGYRLGDFREAAFPLVALLVRAVHEVTGLPIAHAQVVVANVSGLAAAVLFWVWLGRRRVAPLARWIALVLLLVYPYSFVLFGYGYSDPTLVALVLGALLLAESGWPVLAGVVGALATATRPNALPLVAALLVYELIDSGALSRRPAPTHPGAGGGVVDGARTSRWQIRLRAMGVRRWGVLLSLGGVVAYSAWLVGHAGSALYWLEAQGHYGHGSILSPRTWLKVNFFAAPGEIVTNFPWAINEVVSGVVVLTAIALLPRLHRRLGAAITVLAIGVLLIGWEGPRGFAPGGRYLLPVLPAYLVVASEWLAPRRRAAIAAVAAGVVGTAALVALFTLGGDLWLEW